jgi:membrane protein insertase Oxa1/YidC/SpoIIIJ
LAIIAFTIIIKTILLPLTVQSTRSARAMQESPRKPWPCTRNIG